MVTVPLLGSPTRPERAVVCGVLGCRGSGDLFLVRVPERGVRVLCWDHGSEVVANGGEWV